MITMRQARNKMKQQRRVLSVVLLVTLASGVLSKEDAIEARNESGTVSQDRFNYGR